MSRRSEDIEGLMLELFRVLSLWRCDELESIIPSSCCSWFLFQRRILAELELSEQR